MGKPTPARYRTTHWFSYTAALHKRGSLLIWLDKEMGWLAPHDGSQGRPAGFAAAPIWFCLTIKALFKLPPRQTTGIVASLLKMTYLDWAVLAIFQDFDGFYSPRRRHSALRGKSPLVFARKVAEPNIWGGKNARRVRCPQRLCGPLKLLLA